MGYEIKRREWCDICGEEAYTQGWIERVEWGVGSMGLHDSGSVDACPACRATLLGRFSEVVDGMKEDAQLVACAACGGEDKAGDMTCQPDGEYVCDICMDEIEKMNAPAEG